MDLHWFSWISGVWGDRRFPGGWRRMAADGGIWDGSRTPIIPLLDDSMMACWRIPWIDDVMSGWWSDECGWRMVWIVNGEWWIDDWNDWMEGLLTRSSLRSSADLLVGLRATRKPKNPQEPLWNLHATAPNLFTGYRLCRRAPTLDFLMFGYMIFINSHWFWLIFMNFNGF